MFYLGKSHCTLPAGLPDTFFRRMKMEKNNQVQDNIEFLDGVSVVEIATKDRLQFAVSFFLGGCFFIVSIIELVKVIFCIV